MSFLPPLVDASGRDPWLPTWGLVRSFPDCYPHLVSQSPLTHTHTHTPLSLSLSHTHTHTRTHTLVSSLVFGSMCLLLCSLSLPLPLPLPLPFPPSPSRPPSLPPSFHYSRCVERSKAEHPNLQNLIVYLARDCTGQGSVPYVHEKSSVQCQKMYIQCTCTCTCIYIVAMYMYLYSYIKGV